MNRQWLFLLLGILMPLFWTACKEETPPPPPPEKPEQPAKPAKQYAVPAFDRDSAYAFLAKQLEFGPRVPGTEAHAKTREWLVQKFRDYGFEVLEQKFDQKTFDGKTFEGVNIIARYAPAESRRIMMAAHWDSRPFADSPLSSSPDQAVPGADDGASGVAVLLEIARQISQHPFDGLGVDLVLFDLEDYGESGGSETSWGLGSQYYARNLPPIAPQYGILLDMVGAAHPRFTKEQVSMTYAPQVMNKVWRLAQSMGHKEMFVNVPTGPLVDDHYFVNTIAGIPMIDIINRPVGTKTGFVKHWHTPQDDLSAIDKNTLGAVGQVLTAVIYREASMVF
ncbi:MAG TPA: M28 family peptidase [Phaeodactylibacter sp.]|nr:M28 family peptidase [Phaeodactylibacter sp.]